MAKDLVPAKKRSLSQFYNASLFRADTWNQLKNICQRLAEKGDSAKAAQEARDLMDQIAPMEAYFAFPGRHQFRLIEQLLRDRDFERLFKLVKRIVTALMSESYRRKHLNLSINPTEDEDPAKEEEDNPEERTRRRPYFEVLVVDDMPLVQQRQQRDNLVALRREGGFLYLRAGVCPQL